MANEITHNSVSGLTLYACRFQQDGDVFLTNGSTDEVWGTSGHTADDYDVALTEEDSCGHYKADFDASGNIATGVYQVVIYLQAGANPANSDAPVAQGEIHWSGTAEINVSTLAATLDKHIMATGVVTAVETPDTVFNVNADGTYSLSGANDAYNNHYITVYDDSGSTAETRKITDYVGVTNQITVGEDFSFPIEASTDRYIIWASYSPTAAAGGGATAQEVWEYNITGIETPSQAGKKLKEAVKIGR